MFGATLDVIATGVIMGLGAQGYVRAVDALAVMLRTAGMQQASSDAARESITDAR